MDIHEKIKLFLVQKGFKFKDIADEYGASQQTVSNYLTGENAMPLTFLVWIYEKFQDEIDLELLFSKRASSIIAEPSIDNNQPINKKKVLEKISQILDEEFGS